MKRLQIKSSQSRRRNNRFEAKRNLTQRLERHLKKKKNLHWHFDHLTVVVEIQQILVDPSETTTECKRGNSIISLLGGQIIVPRFGLFDTNGFMCGRTYKTYTEEELF